MHNDRCEVRWERKEKQKLSTPATAHLNDKISRFPIIYHNYHGKKTLFSRTH